MPQDLLARLGGDEFVIVLTEINHPDAVTQVAQRVLEVMAQPFMVDNREVFSGCSIGIALYPEDGADMDILLKHADTALYYAKDRGRNNYQMFSHSMNVAATRRLTLESYLRKASGKSGTDYLLPAAGYVEWPHHRRGSLAALEQPGIGEGVAGRLYSGRGGNRLYCAYRGMGASNCVHSGPNLADKGGTFHSAHGGQPVATTVRRCQFYRAGRHYFARNGIADRICWSWKSPRAC